MTSPPKPRKVEWEIVPSTEAKVNGKLVRGDFYLVQRLEQREHAGHRKRGKRYTKDVPVAHFFTVEAAKTFLQVEHGVDLRKLRIRRHVPGPIK